MASIKDDVDSTLALSAKLQGSENTLNDQWSDRCIRYKAFQSKEEMYGGPSSLIPDGSALDSGIQELLDLYHPHVDHIHYWTEFKVAEQNFRGAVIFRIKK